MKCFKRIFLSIIIATVAMVLTFGTFSTVSADETSALPDFGNNYTCSTVSADETSALSDFGNNYTWVQYYDVNGPTENHNYYFAFEFDTLYKVVFLNDTYIKNLNTRNYNPYFNYSYILGTQHVLTLSNIFSYSAYVYDVPKEFLSGVMGEGFEFVVLNNIILNNKWEFYSSDISSEVTSNLQLKYSYNGSELSYDSSLYFFTWNYPPVVAGNFTFMFPSGFSTTSKKDSTIKRDQLYDIFRQSAAEKAGFNLADTDLPYQNGYNDGYDVGKAEGYEEGIGEAERGIFATAKATAFSFDTAPYEFPLDSLYLDPISYGISFRTIGIAADRLLSSNDWSDTFRFSVTVEFDLPFVFSRQSIFVSQALGFYSLMFYDVNGRVYEITDLTDDGSLTTNGYPLVASSGSEAVYGQLINKWVVEFANPDYIGNFISPFEGVFQSGYITGYDEGYDVGHNKGYNEGHNDGFLVGRDYSKEEYAAEMTGWNLIADGFSSVLSVFNIKVFGIISLGDIFSIVLIFGVVFFVFKLIRG